MTMHDEDENVLTNLSTLRPDSSRAGRLRARCHTEFERGRLRSQRRAAMAAFARHVVAPMFVAGLCALCLGDLLETAMQTLALAR